MKKNMMLVLLLLAAFAANAAQEAVKTAVPDKNAAKANTLTAAAAPVGKNYVRAGALESVKDDLYILRQRSSKLEFAVNETAKIYMTEKVSFDKVVSGNYLVIRGPKNKKVVLANSINIYADKKAYAGTDGKDEAQAKADTLLIKGTVKQADPMIIMTDENVEYRVEHDEDSHWVLNREVAKSELKIGDRIVLYFDKVVSIRYINSPVKILIKRAPEGN